MNQSDALLDKVRKILAKAEDPAATPEISVPAQRGRALHSGGMRHLAGSTM